MPCRVPKRRFSCGAPQHLTKNLYFPGGGRPPPPSGGGPPRPTERGPFGQEGKGPPPPLFKCPQIDFFVEEKSSLLQQKKLSFLPNN